MMQVDTFLRLIESIATASWQAIHTIALFELILVLLLVAVSLIAHILIVVRILWEEFVQFRVWWVDLRGRHSGC